MKLTTEEAALDSITLELAQKVVEYWNKKNANKTYELEEENLRVEPEYVDNVTVFENDGNQYFTFDAAQIHAKRLGKRIPTKEEWETICKKYRANIFRTLPLAGFRFYLTADYNSEGTDGYYWASSLSGDSGYFVRISATQGGHAYFNNRAFGLSVRCLKD